MPISSVNNYSNPNVLLNVYSMSNRQETGNKGFPWPNNVKNVPVDLQVMQKESLLNREIRKTPTLLITSNIEHMPSRNHRFMAIGAAVTAVVNFAGWQNIADKCHAIPFAANKMEAICTNNSTGHDKSVVNIKRGMEFVKGLTDITKEGDAKLYNAGLSAGLEILKVEPDMSKLNEFSRLFLNREQAKALADRGGSAEPIVTS